MVQRTTLQPRLSDICPLELHAVFCPCRRWSQGFILQKETSLESQTAMGRGGLEEEGRREGVRGEVRVSGLTGTRDVNGRLTLL